MGYSQAQKANSRDRILEVASRLIREGGFASLGVADCMRQAGLTHGAFYGHFSSREHLIVEAFAHALSRGEQRIKILVSEQGEETSPLRAITDAYFNDDHIKNPGNGCALCAFAGDARHADVGIKHLLSTHLRGLADRLSDAAGHGDGSGGLAVAATIVGAITLARAVDDEALAASIISSARQLISSQDRLKHSVFSKTM
jgi:TetR/AcrR family transcriptional regulator, transcriptional repressor for nem operon